MANELPIKEDAELNAINTLSEDVTSDMSNVTCQENEEDESKALSNTSNINKEDIDEETERRLRGDAIGNTLYSASFVVKTLLKFQDFEWSTDFENDLCFLWDMTVEKDVCDYLIKLSYPSIAATSIVTTNDSNNRFIEIIVGILGNILCSNPENKTELMQMDDVNIVISLIGHEDPLILIQVLRFIQGLIYLHYKDFEFVNDDVMEKIVFILANSMNKDLLPLTIDVVSKLTSDHNIKSKLIKGNLLHSSIVAFQTLKKRSNYNYENQEGKTLTINLVQIITNFCLYIDEDDNNKRIFNETIVYKDMIFKVINSMLKYYTKDEESLIPIPDEFDFYFDSINVILKTLGVGCVKELLINLMKILRVCILNEYDREFLIVTFTHILSETNRVDLDNYLRGFEHLQLCVDTLRKDITKLQIDCKNMGNSLRTLNRDPCE